MFDERAAAAPVAHYSAKRRVDGDSADLTLAKGAEPLQALYLLDHGVEVSIAPLPERDAFMVLLRASFQLHLDDKERSRELFERIGGLQAAVPVRRLSYPRVFGRLGAVREALMKDAEELASPPVLQACAWS